MKFETHRAIALADMPRVTRQEFCEHMDEIMNTVTRDDSAYVITHSSGRDYVLCPASWFEVRQDDDFDAIIVCAVRYAMGRRTYMPSLVEGFVRRWMDFLEENTLTVIARDIDEDLRMYEDMADAGMWARLRDDIRAKLNKNVLGGE